MTLALALPGTVAAEGLEGARREAIEELITAKMAAQGIPGLSIAMVIDGELVWEDGYGTADVENSVPATAATVYRTASIGKPMTAVAVMRLVEDGKLDLDRPIQDYCPTFPEKRWPVTTRHLLSHTSGIRHYGGPRDEQESFNTEHFEDVVTPLRIFKDDPLDFQPGTAYQYSTFGYNVLGCVIEGASGSRYLDYMARSVFAPAGMTRTREDDPFAVIPHRAAGYTRSESGELRNSRMVDMSSKLPAGGFVTTAGDLARFAAAFMSHRLVSRETVEKMLTPSRLANGEVLTYGLGWGLIPDETWYGEREAFHGGGTPQVNGMLYLLPDRRFAVAILMNLEDVEDRVGFAAQIAKIALALDAQQAP